MKNTKFRSAPGEQVEAVDWHRPPLAINPSLSFFVLCSPLKSRRYGTVCFRRSHRTIFVHLLQHEIRTLHPSASHSPHTAWWLSSSLSVVVHNHSHYSTRTCHSHSVFITRSFPDKRLPLLSHVLLSSPSSLPNVPHRFGRLIT